MNEVILVIMIVNCVMDFIGLVIKIYEIRQEKSRS